MRARAPEGELKACLERFRKLGGVVDYCVFPLSGAVSADLHQEAAVGFIGCVSAVKRHPFSGRPAAAAGHPVTLREFIGPCYDWKQQRLIVRGRGQYVNRYFVAGARETKANVVRLPPNSGPYVTQGYAQAFSEPSYGMDATPEEVNCLFLAINQPLFSGFPPDLAIYQWSTDWSSYFDAGHEWWGSFLWTVYNPHTGCIVAVGASTTD